MMGRNFINSTNPVIRTWLPGARVQIDGTIVPSVSRWTPTLVGVDQINAHLPRCTLHLLTVVYVDFASLAFEAEGAVAGETVLARAQHAGSVVLARFQLACVVRLFATAAHPVWGAVAGVGIHLVHALAAVEAWR